jgi:hypothetical protein
LIWFKSKYKPGQLCLGFFLFVLTLIACQEKQQEQKLSKQENSKLSVEQMDQLLVDLLEIQGEIQSHPKDVQLRKKLLEKSQVKSKNIFITAGYGIPPKGDKSEAMKQYAAEQAAYIDACRWIGYLQLWEKDISQPDFGSINSQIINTTKIHVNKSATNQVQVLVEMPR